MTAELSRLPETPEDAATRLRMVALPAPIRWVAERLVSGGHAAALVGGAVRDALLGRPRGDWDLATSATPDEVRDTFPRTIATGIQHGTVTVLAGRGEDRHAVEVTTFRGEGDYLDGRHPSEVTFHRDLVEDLARRDFTINAFAWEPIPGRFTDAWGGLADLRAGLIRAVGDPERRFGEDGLRTMRAVRFAATLGFELDPATQGAIAGALDVFDRVSRERVRVELIKLLGALRPSRGLVPMLETGLWGRVLVDGTRSECEAAIEAVDALPADPELRLIRLARIRRGRPEEVEHMVEALRPSRALRARVLAGCSPHVDALAAALDRDDGEGVRRAAAGIGRRWLDDAPPLLGLDPRARAAFESALEGAALGTKELAVRGRDLIEAGVARPGPELGTLLEALLDVVLTEPARNTADRLIAEARTITGG